MELAPTTKYDEIKEPKNRSNNVDWTFWNIELCQLSWVEHALSGFYVSPNIKSMSFTSSIFFLLHPCHFTSFCIHTQEEKARRQKPLCVLLVFGHIYQVLSNDLSSFLTWTLFGLLLDATADGVAILYLSILTLNLIVFEPMLCVTSNKVMIRREKRRKKKPEFDLSMIRMCMCVGWWVIEWMCVLRSMLIWAVGNTALTESNSLVLVFDKIAAFVHRIVVADMVLFEMIVGV